MGMRNAFQRTVRRKAHATRNRRYSRLRCRAGDLQSATLARNGCRAKPAARFLAISSYESSRKRRYRIRVVTVKL